jgi:hypothetical protein
MTASVAIRAAISVFIVVLLGVVRLGWEWTASHQPPGQAAASHAVLLLSALAGVAGLIALWRKGLR